MAVLHLFTIFLFSFSTAAIAAQESFSENCGVLSSALGDVKRKAAFKKMLKVDAGKTKHRVNGTNSVWGGSYMPMEDGGIANRWQTSDGGKYELLNIQNGKSLSRKATIERIKAMKQSDIDKLSPAEKYDLAFGNYDFAATVWELGYRGPLRKPKPQFWEGFCNGCRAAGINTKEPGAKLTLTNRQKIKVNFNRADIKALASANYFWVKNASYGDVGTNGSSNRSNKGASPNPAAIDITLRAYVGEANRGFVYDHHMGSQIWNVAAIGYNRKITKTKKLTAADRRRAGVPKDAEKSMEVEVEIELLGELEISEANLKTVPQIQRGKHIDSETWSYTLYVAKDGEILDGKWKYKTKNQPDFIWFSSGAGADRTEGGNPHMSDRRIQKMIKDSNS